MAELKACPFCGGTDFSTDYDGINPNHDWVTCLKCELCGNWEWIDGDIGWNHRHAPELEEAVGLLGNLLNDTESRFNFMGDNYPCEKQLAVCAAARAFLSRLGRMT